MPNKIDLKITHPNQTSNSGFTSDLSGWFSTDAGAWAWSDGRALHDFAQYPYVCYVDLTPYQVVTSPPAYWRAAQPSFCGSDLDTTGCGGTTDHITVSAATLPALQERLNGIGIGKFVITYSGTTAAIACDTDSLDHLVIRNSDGSFSSFFFQRKRDSLSQRMNLIQGRLYRVRLNARAEHDISQGIDHLVQNAAGSGYTYASAIAGPDGVGSALRPVISSGGVASVQVVQSGHGFSSPPAVTIAGDGSSADYSAVMTAVDRNVGDMRIMLGSSLAGTISLPPATLRLTDDFTVDPGTTGWTFTGGVAWGGTYIGYPFSSGTGTATKTIAGLVSGQTYIVQFTLTTAGAGFTCTTTLGGNAGQTFSVTTDTKTFTTTMTSGTGTTVSFEMGNASGQFTDVSVWSASVPQRLYQFDAVAAGPNFDRLYLEAGGDFRLSVDSIEVFELPENEAVDTLGTDKISLNFAIANIRDLSNRDASFSKTINLPGSKNNNTVFKHNFDISIDTKYNLNKRANFTLAADDVIFLNGYLKLESATVVDRDFVSYSVTLKGDNANFTRLLEQRNISDLSLKRFNHILTRDAVVDSWTSTKGVGYMYPLVDYGYNWNSDCIDRPCPGTQLNTTTSTPNIVLVEELRPAIYVKTVWDQIFSEIGFTYTSKFLNGTTGDPRYDSVFAPLVMPCPHTILKSSQPLLHATSNADRTYSTYNVEEVIPFQDDFTGDPLLSTGNYDTYNNWNASTALPSDLSEYDIPVEWTLKDLSVQIGIRYDATADVSGLTATFDIVFEDPALEQQRANILHQVAIGSLSSVTDGLDVFTYDLSRFDNIQGQNMQLRMTLTGSTACVLGPILAAYQRCVKIEYFNTRPGGPPFGFPYTPQVGNIVSNTGVVGCVGLVGGDKAGRILFADSSSIYLEPLPGSGQWVFGDVVQEELLPGCGPIGLQGTVTVQEVDRSRTPLGGGLGHVFTVLNGGILNTGIGYPVSSTFVLTIPGHGNATVGQVTPNGSGIVGTGVQVTCVTNSLGQIQSVTINPSAPGDGTIGGGSGYTDGASYTIVMPFPSAPASGASTFKIKTGSWIQIGSPDALNPVTGMTVQEGAVVTLTDALPTNMKQIDWVKGIITMFNLYVQYDKNTPGNLIIEPRDLFFDGSTVDWSTRVDRGQDTLIQPPSDFLFKDLVFTWRDDDDALAVDYKRTQKQVLGYKRITADNDFVVGSTNFDLPFAGTLLHAVTTVGDVSTGGCNTGDHPSYQGMVVPRIWKTPGRVTDFPNNIYETSPFDNEWQPRLMYYAGTRPVMDPSAAVSPSQTWKLWSDATADAIELDYYPFVGMTDDPFNPTFDLLWSEPTRIYYADGQAPYTYRSTSNTLFRLFWAQYINDILDKDARLVTFRMYLTVDDIQSLDFRRKVMVDGQLYTLNAISDWDPVTRGTCKVELLKFLGRRDTGDLFSQEPAKPFTTYNPPYQG